MMMIRNLLLHCLFIGAVASEFSLIEYRGDFRTQEALIFETCGINYENVIHYHELNKLSPIFIQQLHNKFHSITYYNKELNYNKNIEHVKKVDAIIITTSSRFSLSRILKEMKKTVWWDVMIPVYILHDKDGDCAVATTTLSRALDRNILTSYFPCIDEKNDIQVYTYNRFARRASSGWIEVCSQHNVTYYRRKYDPKTICKGFNFDRSEKLDGYEVTITLPIGVDHTSCRFEYSNYAETVQNIDCLMKRHHEIYDALKTRLNVTVEIRTVDRRSRRMVNRLLHLNGKNENKKLTQKLRSFGSDLILFNVGVKFIKDRSWYFETYPLAWEAIGIATYNHGYKTIGEKIWDFYGIWTILFTIIVLMVTFAVIWFSESKKTAFATFEIIRLLISHNLHTRMNTLPLRIFFITVLIYFLILQTTFNGHLAKFLTHPELRKQVETFKDLEKFGHAGDGVKSIININMKKSDDLDEKLKCLLGILSNRYTACIFDHATLLWYSSTNGKLYVSKKPFSEEYNSYFIKRNWPLVNRVNSFFMSLEDFGFRRLWSDDHLTHSSIRKLTVTEDKSDEDFHPITLENLMFSFSILAIGLTSATISFCVEVFMTDKSKWSVIPFMKNVKNKTLQMRKRIKIPWSRCSVVFFRNK